MPTQVSKVEFFKPGAIIAALADWELQTGGNPTLTRQRAQSLLSTGDQMHAVQYGAQIAYVENFTAKTVVETASKTELAIPGAGAISNGAHVDSLQVSYTQTAAPTLAVNSHKHAAINGTPATHDPCRVYVGTVVLPIRAIGVPSTLEDKDGNTIFECPAGIGMKSLTYGLAVTHTDEPDGDGGHLAGQNRDGVETLTIEFTGKVAVAELSIDGSWMLPDSDADGQGNTIATTKSITITKHIAFDEDATPDGGDK